MSYLPWIAAIVLAYLLWLAATKWRRRKMVERSLRNTLGNMSSKPIGKVSPQTRHKLIKLLGNHQPTVDRLIDQARLRNPGEEEQWYWEKVLYDLERDRWR
jgi:hypothetical protein